MSMEISSMLGQKWTTLILPDESILDSLLLSREHQIPRITSQHVRMQSSKVLEVRR